MKTKKIIILCVTLVIFLLLSSCQNNNELQAVPTSEIDIQSGYPFSSNAEAIDNHLGYPISNYSPITAPTFAPNASFGIVHGQLLFKGEPVVGYSVYLAELISNEKGEERVAALKMSSSPQAILDSNGKFVFNNVEPDKYALMFSDGLSSYLLLIPQQEIQEAIIIIVEKENIIDLGTLDYIDFPLDINKTP
jgi:hypothetical protein